MLPIFTAAIFLSAALLFLVQPMVAKMILPMLGGSPAVWNTCMVFFQALLLAGYFYSHLLSRVRSVRAQALIHGLVLLSAAIALPLGMPSGWTPPTEDNPIPWLLKLLALTAGLPYFAVSTTGPLLQRWFSRTSHRHASDPYFLYAASNAGSILGLLAYPFIIEPTVALSKQGWLWTFGYILFGAGVAACAWKTATKPATKPGTEPTAAESRARPAQPERPITWRDRLLWIALAAVPSSLMLGATSHVTTDVASAPLLWVIPLTLYLLTFILAFSSRVKVSAAQLSRFVPLIIITLGVFFLMRGRNLLGLQILVHFGSFFVLAWMCHARLAAARPGVAGLTEYYLWLAVGGVAGGTFNALIAPVTFDTFLEYPIAVVAALLLRPAPAQSRRAGRAKAATSAPRRDAGPAAAPPAESSAWTKARNWVFGPVLGPLLVASLLYGVPDYLFRTPAASDAVEQFCAQWKIDPRTGIKLLIILPPTLLTFLMSQRRWTFAIAFAVLMSTVQLWTGWMDGIRIHTERTFFGIYDVFRRPDGAFHTLRHGTTTHGVQCTVDDHRFRPLSYYFPTGPIGALFDVFYDDPKFDQCAFVGLGAGTLAAYGKAGREMTFFEIDPAVVKIAQNPKLFTYLQDSDSKPVRIVVGDARQMLAREADGRYGLIVLDAFSSDAIPVHLMTKEAFEMYLRKLRPDGIIAVHISNRYFDLSHVLGALGRELNLVGYGKFDKPSPEEERMGKTASEWVMIARRMEDLGDLNRNRDWSTMRYRPGDPLWTDDFSNVLSVLDWSR
ncbi:MAG: fused MFS/spermidine synthase [Phycisphaerales bacterium]|nr:fused MFS/spermidine synthase [Phycisphaerales bacterium]